MKIRLPTDTDTESHRSPWVILGAPVVLGLVLGVGLARALTQRSVVLIALLVVVAIVEAGFVATVGLATGTARARPVLVAGGSIIVGLLVGVALWR